jgi:sensor histidine kinase YesM
MTPDITYRRIDSFWRLQILGWLAYTVIYGFHIYLFREFNVAGLIRLGVNMGTGFLLTSALRLIYHRIDFRSWNLVSMAGLTILLSILVSFIWIFAGRAILSIFVAEQAKMASYKWIRIIDAVFFNTALIVTWSALYFTLKLWREWMAQAESTGKAELLMQKAQLQMLRYQLNPHFLFNALNSIRALISEDKKAAKSLITELSEFLRYSLVTKNHTDVPLGEEIEAVRHYFAIEKKRYEKKLMVRFQVDPLTEEFPVMPFIIHPLAENAILHGMRTSPMPLRIDVDIAMLNDETLSLAVRHTGKWVSHHGNGGAVNGNGYPVNGNGESNLENIRQRLNHAYPGRHRFSVEEESDGVRVRIVVSKEKGVFDEKTA